MVSVGALKASVKKDIEAVKGKGGNAHLATEFAERLMVDLVWLPIWSCVVRDKFGYGRIPATSAQVESEFNKIKNLLLKDETLPMRVDKFIKKTRHASVASQKSSTLLL